jgi:hypothetical protein
LQASKDARMHLHPHWSSWYLHVLNWCESHRDDDEWDLMIHSVCIILTPPWVFCCTNGSRNGLWSGFLAEISWSKFFLLGF